MEYFAVDAGGTFVKWAVVTEDYEIKEKGQFPTPYEDAEKLVERIWEEARKRTKMQNGKEFLGIGLSVPGTVLDDEDGTVKGGGLLRYLHGAPLGKMMREKSGLPSYVENDGKSCALGEYSAGALKGCKVGVVIALGTGVGGGIVIDGKVFKGAHSFAGEFSFIQLSPMASGDMDSRFGGAGGWRSGLLRHVLEEKGLPMDTDMDGKQIFELVCQGDRQAMRGLERYAADVAQQIWNIQAVLDPDVIAIGGGISGQPVLTEKIREAVERMTEENPLKQFPTPNVVTCLHRNDANLLGAVCNCRQRMKRLEDKEHGYIEI